VSGFEAQGASLLDAMFVVADPGKRLYWMHVLSAALLALIYCRYAARRQSIADLASSVLDSAYWWNRSTRLDYGLFALNNFLKVAMFAPVLGGQVAVSLVVTKFLHFNIAESHLFVWPPIAITVAFTIVAFLFESRCTVPRSSFWSFRVALWSRPPSMGHFGSERAWVCDDLSRFESQAQPYTFKFWCGREPVD
jgi:hypothetical protein